MRAEASGSSSEPGPGSYWGVISNDVSLAHLRAAGWLLTRNLRQARILRYLHDRARCDEGAGVWPTARILTLADWLARQWQEASAGDSALPELLPAAAIRWLWREQVEADAGGLLDPAELAGSARASWLVMREHGGDAASLRRWPLTRDQQAFLHWSQAIERKLADLGAADADDLTRLIVDRNALSPAGMPLLLVGFDRLTPAQARLVEALRRRGWIVTQPDPAEPTAHCHRHAAADPAAEERTIAGWLRERLTMSPAGLHAVVMPNLAARRSVIERTLAAQLQPELELPGEVVRDRVFDLPGGSPLRLQPPVAAALDALECLSGIIAWDLASRMLRSPWLDGAGGETAARIRCELALRSTEPQLEWNLPALADCARRHGAVAFAAQLAATASAAGGPAERSAVAWAECFGSVLAGWGWPGSRPLGSGAFQAADAFRELLRELAGIGRVAPRLALRQALAELRRAAAMPFQPERGEPGVFVFDGFEPPGIRFDSLWVAGLTAAAWPRPVAVDPWLPIEIQRSLGMPGVSAEERIAEARQVLALWQRSADELVLSWPRTENDTDADPSVLLPDCAELSAPVPGPQRTELLFAARPLEAVDADAAPALVPGRVRGGARLFELQAQCPFRALAELRLGAKRLEEPEPGPDPRRRGQVLHHALEHFWRETRSRSQLLEFDDEQLAQRVAAVVALALHETLPAGIGRRARSLEQEWQQQAIRNLLDLERGRPDFEVVEIEGRMAGTLGGLELQLRVDRIDRIGTALVVIDYKTGRAARTQWRGARMEAPQLPLYAVLHPGRPAGIAFATVGGSEAGFTGVAQSGGLIDDVGPAAGFELTEAREKGFDWQQITQHWWAWLERLARDYLAGHASVDPRRGAETCRRCHLAPLCRVVDAGAADDAEDDGDGD